MNKSWYASKTIWFNVLAVIVMAATLFGYDGQLSVDMKPYADIIGIVLTALVNIILRFKTVQAVGK